MRRPSGENAAEQTTSAWPRKMREHSPVVVLQSLEVRSPDAVNICRPSGEKAAEQMPISWPTSVRKHSPVAALQSLASRGP
eukprot:13236443-Alexandrium_andersonii.AAC.1